MWRPGTWRGCQARLQAISESNSGHKGCQVRAPAPRALACRPAARQLHRDRAPAGVLLSRLHCWPRWREPACKEAILASLGSGDKG